MTDLKLEQALLAAKPVGKPSPFTQSVMSHVKATATISPTGRKTNATKWSIVMKYIKQHKIQAATMTLALIGAVGFSGYAYATGTDPVSLIHRIIKGNSVEINYQGRTFVHGKGLSYTDAAVTAYAELNTVWDLHFRASNAFTIPKNGVEYVGAPHVDYHYPWVGTVTSVDQANIYATRQRTIGDKMEHSSNSNDTVAIPRSLLTYYVKGEPSTNSNLAGHIISVYQDDYLKHTIGTKGMPSPVTHYFVFELTHPLKDILEADQTGGSSTTNPSQQGIVETSWGDTSNICLNNGADTCTWQTLPGEKSMGQSLYLELQYWDNPTQPGVPPKKLATPVLQPAHNPDVVAFSEMLTDNQQRYDLITRNTEGHITKISGNTITLKSSSGATWTLDLKPGVLEQFKTKWSSPLKTGDLIGASLVANISDLDNHHFDNTHIYMLGRY